MGSWREESARVSGRSAPSLARHPQVGARGERRAAPAAPTACGAVLRLPRGARGRALSGAAAARAGEGRGGGARPHSASLRVRARRAGAVWELQSSGRRVSRLWLRPLRGPGARPRSRGKAGGRSPAGWVRAALGVRRAGEPTGPPEQPAALGAEFGDPAGGSHASPFLLPLPFRRQVGRARGRAPDAATSRTRPGSPPRVRIPVALQLSAGRQEGLGEGPSAEWLGAAGRGAARLGRCLQPPVGAGRDGDTRERLEGTLCSRVRSSFPSRGLRDFLRMNLLLESPLPAFSVLGKEKFPLFHSVTSTRY